MSEHINIKPEDSFLAQIAGYEFCPVSYDLLDSIPKACRNSKQNSFQEGGVNIFVVGSSGRKIAFSASWEVAQQFAPDLVIVLCNASQLM